MKKYLLDTGVLSASSKRRPPAVMLRWLKTHEERSFVSVVSLAELSFGVEMVSDPELRTKLKEWLAGLRASLSHAILPLNEPVLVEWKTLLAQLKRKNRTISCEDSLLAATARYYGLTVVTTNPKDFEPTEVDVVSLRYRSST